MVDTSKNTCYDNDSVVACPQMVKPLPVREPGVPDYQFFAAQKKGVRAMPAAGCG